jgi:hypothetical protein
MRDGLHELEVDPSLLERSGQPPAGHPPPGARAARDGSSAARLRSRKLPIR